MKLADSPYAELTSWLVLGLFAVVMGAVLVSMIRQARQDIQENSPATKMQFQEEFPGLEAAPPLSPARKKRVVALVNKRFCPCNCGYTIPNCLKFDSGCPLRQKNLASIQEIIRASSR